jgi:hypothetical protein
MKPSMVFAAAAPTPIALTSVIAIRDGFPSALAFIVIFSLLAIPLLRRVVAEMGRSDPLRPEKKRLAVYVIAVLALSALVTAAVVAMDIHVWLLH